ncbi:ATP-binding protein [Rhizobacter sp. J219]|uniref:hybrid sensor histidine kinase/response regulator n=1 Tax=Rhizobacter sp. J219 TaxID=2898430 RepID=UPI002151999A|nr:ATP-binding protein [Rhizobacter sp. J219]MCR5882504.1 ATP-binding protein [Rhizobacter sp. J219]
MRTAFVAMLLMATVPVALLMSYLLLEKMRAEQARLRADLDRDAQVLAQAIDNEVQATIDALRILGLSESLRHGDVREFERTVAARGPLRSGWQGSFLTDTRGLVIFDTTGASRRGALPPVPGFRQMLWGRTPLVSGLVAHAPTGQAATVIAVPVVIDGNLRFGLGVWVPWAAWQVLVKRSAPSEGYSVLFDREHRVIARNTDPQRVGELLPETVAPGINTYGAMRPVPLAGWGVRRDVATAPVAAGQIRSVALAWATAAACLLLGVTMALLLARRIRRPLEALARDGGVARLGVVHVREIAALRDAMQASRERDQAAHDSLRRKADEFETLFNSSPIGLAFAQDRECENVLRNSAMVQLFGRMGGDVEASVFHEGRPVEPKEMPLCRAAHTGQAVAVIELEFRVPGRPVVYALANAVPLRDAQGRPRGAISAMVDITARKEVEAQLVETHDQLKAASQAKDEFLAMLGHELRNPLNAISTAVDVLHHGEMADPVARSARAIIRRQTLHLSHMIGDLLDMTRILSGKVRVVCEPMDLSQLVRRTLDMLAVTGDTSKHTLERQLAADAWVEADASRLEQVVTNLVDNAIKYTPVGRRIWVRVRPDGGEVVFEVEDEGDGIAPELLPRVFDLFVQGERTLDRRAGGLGIGLTLVKRLVELHGGRVSAASSTAGSRFEVRLPRVPAAHATPAHVDRDARPGHLTVLVVEDNVDALQSMCDLLRLDGHAVIGENSGTTGLESLLAHWPDVAIVDIGLPGLNGFELALAARSRGYSGRMIAVSGYGQSDDVRRAMKSGFDLHAVKPVDAQQLRQWMRESAHAHA